MFQRCKIVLVVLALVPTHSLLAQRPDVFPLFQLTMEGDVATHPQIWSFAQDSSGVVYVGHSQGIAAFDGRSWTEMDMPTKSVARTLLVVGSKLFVGMRGDFGYVDLSDPELAFSSFRQMISTDIEIGNVWNSHRYSNGVLFQTRNNLFVVSDSGLARIPSLQGFHTSFQVGGRLFVREIGRGLVEFLDGELVDVAGGSFFRDKKVYFMQQWRGNYLVGTRDHGFFEMTTNNITAVDGSAVNRLRGSRIYSGVRLQSGDYAIATLNDGVMIVDEDLEQTTRLPVDDSVINVVYEDAAQALWIGTHNSGVHRMDFDGPLAVLDSRSGIEGAIYDIGRTSGSYLIATGAGLFRAGSGRVSFAPDERFAIARAVEANDDSYAIGLEDGLYFSDWDRVDSTFGQVHDLQFTEDGTLLVASDNGLYRVSAQQKTSLADRDIRSVVQAPGGPVWAVNSGRELELFDEGTTQKFDLSALEGTHFRLKLAGGKPILFSEAAVAAPHISPSGTIQVTTHDAFSEASFEDSRLLDLAQHPDGSIWAVTSDKVLVSTWQDSVYTVKRHPYLSFKRGRVSRLFFQHNGVVWVSDGDELVRYDPAKEKSYEARFPALVRKVTISQTDSVIFNGTLRVPLHASAQPELSFDDNDLTFEFSSPEFNRPEETLFQYKLEGKQNEWSDWAKTASVDFNNLREGSYTFVVRSKNFLGYVSPEGKYSFTVLPPWYRTWWAYCLLSITLLAASFLALKYYHMLAANKRAQEQARELARERIVNERLQDANEQLQVANMRLQEVNSLKDEFLANTSHELRTPITAIIGYSAVLKEELEGTQKQFVEVIESSSQRLMHTLNMVLDLSQLRSGTVEMVPVELNLSEEIDAIINDKQANWPATEAQLVTDYPDDEVRVSIDRHALSTIVENLMDNAFKFTNDGEIKLTVTKIADKAVIRVTDDGVGMDESFLPHIFDEFRQESDGLARTFEGNGLGLAVTARMVELSNGTIEVESTKGVGSTFTVILPLTEPHLGTVQDRPAVSRGEPRMPKLDDLTADERFDIDVDE